MNHERGAARVRGPETNLTPGVASFARPPYGASSRAAGNPQEASLLLGLPSGARDDLRARR